MPIAARWLLMVGPNNVLALRALWFHIIRLPTSLAPIARPTYSGGGWYGDGRWLG